jgi:hypothetical protein
LDNSDFIRYIYFKCNTASAEMLIEIEPIIMLLARADAWQNQQAARAGI